MLSMLPERSTSPFSTLSLFTCRSVPLTISIPCSVSSRISFRSKERTSNTPVTAAVFLLLTTNLCVFAIRCSSIRTPSHSAFKYMRDSLYLFLKIHKFQFRLVLLQSFLSSYLNSLKILLT